ncbi:MAG: ferrochelatase [Firmicutes bacterium]|nr:ferrochelatase [Bacillota bacterium]
MIGILLMAYGTPASLDQVEAYYTHIRRGKPPTPELLAELIGRYEAIGGVSPLNGITYGQADALEQALMAQPARPGETYKVYVGMKHCAPFIGDVMDQMAQDGFKEIICAVLAPHYSTMSVAVYMREAREAAAKWPGLNVRYVRQWHLEPAFLDALETRIADVRTMFTDEQRASLKMVFSAHSLPERILAAGDPYPEQLLETSRALADRLGIRDWQFGWQSAGRTSEPWLGPDILTVLDDLGAQGYKAALSCPIGFVADHLEVLYDLDIEATKHAHDLGMAYRRTPSLNVDPGLVEALRHAIVTCPEEVETPSEVSAR